MKDGGLGDAHMAHSTWDASSGKLKLASTYRMTDCLPKLWWVEMTSLYLSSKAIVKSYKEDMQAFSTLDCVKNKTKQTCHIKLATSKRIL